MATKYFTRIRDGQSVSFPYLNVPNFLQDDDCDRLVAFMKENLGDVGVKEVETDDSWSHRLIFENDIGEAWIRDLMQDSASRIGAALQETYGTSQLHDDGLQLVRWPDGTDMVPHADNAFPDGSPHPMWWREYSAIVYLNEDFEDGHFYFAETDPDCRIRPKRGSLIAFKGGFDYIHGVVAPRGKDRVTMASWYTTKPDARNTPPT